MFPFRVTQWRVLWRFYFLLNSILPLTAAELPAFGPEFYQQYDTGELGLVPQQSLRSVDFNTTRLLRHVWSPQCDKPDSYYFFDPQEAGYRVLHDTPQIIDQNGYTVWFNASYGESYGFRPQIFHGEYHLTWWGGTVTSGLGYGYLFIMDKNYQIVKNFTAIGHNRADQHEFTITPDDTALILVDVQKPWDLSPWDYYGEAYIVDMYVQEIDIDTGRLIFEWRASDHIDLLENLSGKTPGFNNPSVVWDVFHINSVEKDKLGNYLISVRHMSTIYYIEGSTGRILWRLGGKLNDFKALPSDVGNYTRIIGQHHVRWHDDMKTMTMFDNQWLHGVSRGIKFAVDTTAMTIRLLYETTHPGLYVSPTRGSMDIDEDDGTVLVSYGSVPAFTEFSPTNGSDIWCDWQFGAIHAGPNGTETSPAPEFTYQVHRATWKGYPLTNPDAVFFEDEGQLYFSWNGATQVKQWILDGSVSQGLPCRLFGYCWRTIGNYEKVGFENSATVEIDKYHRLRISALDAENTTLGIWTCSTARLGVNNNATFRLEFTIAPPSATLAAQFLLEAKCSLHKLYSFTYVVMALFLCVGMLRACRAKRSRSRAFTLLELKRRGRNLRYFWTREILPRSRKEGVPSPDLVSVATKV